jgi:AmmeMemoRadiSam system protein A
MGDQNWELCQTLGEALGNALKGRNALIVASSDLSHFHPYREANSLDSALIKLLEAYDPEEACLQLNSRKVEACGGGPIVSAMIAGKILGADGLKVIKHANSGDVPMGSKDSVVGYLAGVIYRMTNTKEKSKRSEENKQMDQTEGTLTITEKRQLMEIAKTTVDCVVRGKKVPDFVPISDNLKQERGAFVTLKIHGELRGCIGYIIPIKPLYLTVREVAESAALRDPRFPPVSVRELPELEYEISALSPIRKIENVNEIQVGKHGIIIRRGYNQGLLLPQVATEYGWNREQFLEHTCNKAGLPFDAWKKEGTEISIFSAEVFDESDLK